MHMFSPRNVYRNMWELCDAYLRLRLMQTWWHRPHQMCQMKIQFERIEKPYSKILIPIYIYIYLFWRPQILPLSVQHHNGLHTFAPLFGFPTTLGSDFSAPSQKELTIWTRFFSRSLCLASDKIYSFFFFHAKKTRFVEFSAVGETVGVSVIFVHIVTHHLWSRNKGSSDRGVENSAKKSSGRKPFYSIAPRGGFFMSLCFGGTRVSGQWLCFFIGHDHSFAPIAEGTFLQTSVVCTHLLADDEGFLLQGVA